MAGMIIAHAILYGKQRFGYAVLNMLLFREILSCHKNFCLLFGNYLEQSLQQFKS